MSEVATSMVADQAEEATKATEACSLGADQAARLALTVMELAHRDSGTGVAIAVVDPCGHALAFLRGDGAPLRASRIAMMKAYTASRFGCSTAALPERLALAGRPLAEYGDPRFTALAGGIPVSAPSGRLIGAVGVSGRSPEEDHELAEAAVAMLSSMVGSGR